MAADYTPNVKHELSDLEIRGISEELKFEPKKALGNSKIKKINVFLMFGLDIVERYTARIMTIHLQQVLFYEPPALARTYAS
jgi:hypothetical protein